MDRVRVIDGEVLRVVFDSHMFRDGCREVSFEVNTMHEGLSLRASRASETPTMINMWTTHYRSCSGVEIAERLV